MKILASLILFTFISSCTSSNWTHHTGDNSSYSRDHGYCNSLARTTFPGYICRNPLMCAPDETNKVLDQLIGSAATFDNCMYKKGYDNL